MANIGERRRLPGWVSPKFALLSVVIFMAACSSNSCSCNGFEQTPFPSEHYDKTLPNGGQLRVTQSGLGFLQDHIPELISQVQPGGLNFCVPQQTGTPKICTDSTCADGSTGCQLDMSISDAQLQPQPPDTLDANITIGDIGGQDANGDNLDVIDVKIAGATCNLHLYNKNGNKSQPAEIQATLPVKFTIDQNSPTKDLRLDIGDVQMANFTDQVSYELKGAGGVWSGIACTVGGWLSSLFNGTINGMIKDKLTSAIDDIKAQQLCRACGSGQPACPGGSTCGDNGNAQSCMYPDNTCVPRELGVEGKLDIGQLLGNYSQNPDAAVYVMGKAADMATVDTGLSLGLRTGGQPTDFGRCVPVDPSGRPSLEPIDPSPSILADTRPNGGDPFMIGIGVHKRTIEHILWSTWASGAVCMKIDSNSVSQLSAKTLGILLPSIKELAGGDAMVYLQIAPQTAPKVKLGANTVSPDGDTYSIDDPLMTVNWKDLDLHFYVYANERFVRVFTLRADLILPIALAADGQGSIIPVLGDLGDAVQNIRPVKTGLLKEDPQRVIDLIPTLMGMALPSLAGSISQPIQLPEFMGMRIALSQDDITSVDNKTMIALYADLVPASTQPFSAMLDTTIYDTDVDLSEWTASGIPHPKAILDVAADLPAYAQAVDAGDIEYSWRVDGGLWSLYHRTNRLEIKDPMLVLEGRHRIEVRARFRGDPSTTEPEPAVTYVNVDYSAPDFSIQRDKQHVTLAASDAVDKLGDLMFRYRIIDGQGHSTWTPWQHDNTIDLAKEGAPAHFRLVAQVRDRAGHVAEDQQNVVWEPMKLDHIDGPAAPNAGDPQAAGCSAAGQNTPVGAAGGVLALFGVLLLLWRRRQDRPRAKGALAKFGPLALVIAALALAGCSDNAAGKHKAKSCDPACAANQQCVDGACQLAENGCNSDADCSCDAAGQVAVCGDDGMCACQQACADGCGDGQFCCYKNNSCQDLPDPCADKVCDPGFEPKATSPGTGDSATCEVSGAVCDCAPLPPLPLGIHGQYASVAENNGVRAAAVYNKTYTDLMVATVDDSGQPTWYFVDGVPDSGDIEGDLNGPRGGIADQGPDVGTHTAIGVDANGNLHVLYRDEDNGTLKYARGTKGADGYTFETKTIDDQGDTGYYSSVLIDGDTVHAVYSVKQVDDPDNGWQTQLRYINFPVDAPLDQLAPSPTVVYADAANDPCGSSCGSGEECFTSSATCAAPTDDCTDTCADGLACNQGSCMPIFVAPKKAYPFMTGVFAQLSKTSDGLAVTFFDNLQRHVGWATRAADGTWGDAQFLSKRSGPYASVAFDANGKLHLAYMDPATQNLVYQVGVEGDPEIVANGVRDTVDGYLLNDIGEDVDLKLHADGTVQVLYQDATWHKLQLATRDADGNWSTQTLGEPGDPYTGAHGFFAAMVRDVDNSNMAVDFVLNNQTDPSEGKPEFHELQ